MKTIILILALATLIIPARGQGFINLNFESAKNLPTNAGPAVLVAVTNALPGWTASSGPNSLSYVSYITNYLDRGGILELDGGSAALSGNYSVFFGDASISQTGLVPGGTASLQFWAYGRGPGGSLPPDTGFTVSLGGQTLSFSVLSQSSGYWIYGANVPAGLAGQTEALTFLIGGAGSGDVLLDNIAFSPLSIPEPSGFALLGLGALLLRLVRHKSQR